MVVGCSIAVADELPKRPQPSTDDFLRNSLDSHSGDDYDPRGCWTSPKKGSTRPRRTVGPKTRKINRNSRTTGRPSKMVSKKTVSFRPSKACATFRPRLAQGKSDAITQHVQRQVVADLQQIIDEAKKSGKCFGQSMAGNCNKPGKPGSSPNAQPKTNFSQ